MTMTKTVDVLVLGGGGSGMAAAISAAEMGSSVLLIEKNPHLGGTTCLSVGSITASGTHHQKSAGIVDSPEAHFEDMSLFMTPGQLERENFELRKVLVENVP